MNIFTGRNILKASMIVMTLWGAIQVYSSLIDVMAKVAARTAGM